MEVEVLPSSVDVIRSNKLFRIKNKGPTKSLFTSNGQPSQPETRVNSRKLPSDYYNELPEIPSPIPENSKGQLNQLKRWPSAALTLKQLNRHKNDEVRMAESLDKTANRSKGSTDIQQTLIKNFMAQRKANFTVSRKVSNDYDQQFRNASYQERNYESLKNDESSQRIRKKKSLVSHITSYQTVETEPNMSEADPHREVRESPALVLPKIHNRLEPKNLVFGPNVKEHIYRKHAMEVAQGIRYAMRQLKAPPISQLAAKQVSLKAGRNARSKTLILDLDETLVTTKIGENEKEKNIVNVGTEEEPMKIIVRPYVKEFLSKMSKEFELVVFTAADKTYAESVVNFLDPNQKYISHVLHREHCLRTKKGIVIKDLRVIKDRELKNVLIVDNFAPSFSFQIENGVPIISWKGDSADEELKYLMDYLLEAKTYDDMRVFNRERLRLEELGSISADKFAYGNM